jgi:hypothetical protein
VIFWVNSSWKNLIHGIHIINFVIHFKKILHTYCIQYIHIYFYIYILSTWTDFDLKWYMILIHKITCNTFAWNIDFLSQRMQMLWVNNMVTILCLQKRSVHYETILTHNLERNAHNFTFSSHKTFDGHLIELFLT